MEAPKIPFSYLDADFQEALKFDLAWEGITYEDVPGDPGGPTLAGITWEDANIWRKSHGLAPLSLSQARATRLSYLTRDVVEQIYWAHYWVPMRGAQLPSPLDQVLFDAAVNCGCSRSVQWLQAVLGVAIDGQIGPQTLAATNNYLQIHGQEPLVKGLIARRDSYYASRGSWANPFKPGWFNRDNALGRMADKVLAVIAQMKKAGTK